ncbi:MAG: TolB family protein [Geminicoccaceae bacterium]
MTLAVPTATHGVTERASVDTAGRQGNRITFAPPAISADGRFVAFASAATNLVAGDTNGQIDVFVRDRTAGTTQRVNVGSDGAESKGNSGDPAISADGRFVCFFSTASNLVRHDTNGATDVFVHDRTTRRTERANVGASGTQDNFGSAESALLPTAAMSCSSPARKGWCPATPTAGATFSSAIVRPGRLSA